MTTCRVVTKMAATAVLVGRRVHRTITFVSSALNLLENYSTAVSEQRSAVSSFVIHPKSKRLQDQHVFDLTGSRRESVHPPPRFVDFAKNLDIKPWRRLVENATVFENIFETSSFDTVQLAANKNLAILQNLVKVVFSQSMEYDVLRDLYVTGEFKVTSSWYCKGNRVDVRGRPSGLLIKSCDPPRQPFFTLDDIKTVTRDENIEDQDLVNNESVETSDLFSSLTTRDVRSPPTTSQRHCYYPYNHTLVRLHNYEFIDSPVIHNTVLYLHGLAVQQALARSSSGNTLVDVTANRSISPECVQGVITNGKEFLFIWYQLNNLLDSNEAVEDANRNIVMFSRPECLFSDIICTTRRTDYSSRKLSNYDEDVLRKFISLFLWQI